MNKLTIAFDYNIGDMVQLRVNPSTKGIIRSLVVREKGTIMYDLSCEKEGMNVYPFEIEPSE